MSITSWRLWLSLKAPCFQSASTGHRISQESRSCLVWSFHLIRYCLPVWEDPWKQRFVVNPKHVYPEVNLIYSGGHCSGRRGRCGSGRSLCSRLEIKWLRTEREVRLASMPNSNSQPNRISDQPQHKDLSWPGLIWCFIVD